MENTDIELSNILSRLHTWDEIYEYYHLHYDYKLSFQEFIKKYYKVPEAIEINKLSIAIDNLKKELNADNLYEYIYQIGNMHKYKHLDISPDNFSLTIKQGSLGSIVLYRKLAYGFKTQIISYDKDGNYSKDCKYTAEVALKEFNKYYKKHLNIDHQI